MLMFKEHEEYLKEIRKQQNEQILAVETEIKSQIQKLKEKRLGGGTRNSDLSLDPSAASEVDLNWICAV